MRQIAFLLSLVLIPVIGRESMAYRIVCSGRSAGGYTAFPDICRLRNGELLCVFYSGYGHISSPNEDFPKGGRVMAVRSKDEGRTWSKPYVLVDTPHDDRDPHIACLSDGTLILTWFVIWNPKEMPKDEKHSIATFIAFSRDNGYTFSEPRRLKVPSEYWFACSAPVRILSDGSLLLGLYYEDDKRAFGATIKSYDKGKTWGDLAFIGRDSGVYLDAETDVIELKDGRLLAGLRSSKGEFHFALSKDKGRSWGKVWSAGFPGHCPYFLRHSSGVILLAHRLPATALHWSWDEGKTWQGPLHIDDVIGAYPSLVELKDRTVLCVYYEEGEGSSIRATRLRIEGKEVKLVEE